MFLVLPPGKAVAFLAVELGVFGFYLGSSFAPNHIGMPLVSPRLKLDFLRRQVLMSRNVSGGRFMSILMGGLNYQIEHHLFPSMARPYLRKVQPLVAAYCAAEGVPYTQTSLWQSYRVVIRYLNSVGLRGRTPSSARWSRNVAPCDRGRASAPTVLTGTAGRVGTAAGEYVLLIYEHFRPRTEGVPIFTDFELTRVAAPTLVVVGRMTRS